MSKREAMLEQLEASPRALQALLDEEGGEALDGLSGRELERLADALATHVRTALLGARPALLSEAAQTEDDQVLLDSLDTLTAAAAVAKAIVNEPGYQVPQALLAVAEALHDIIFDLQDPRASTLQASIVELCEAWWLAERPGREELVPQTISYLLVSALHEQATTADVRRLWAVRSALGVLDYADPSVSALKKLLLHCLIKPLVLRCAEGRRLLVYFFGLHPPFIADLHRAIRAQIPVCRKSLREIYGEIYFKAWRAASGVYLEKIEEGCLQDLMFHAVHASSASMSTALQQTLSYIHNQKRQRGVDGALLRLYEPILWRSLAVANANVRRNAATILVEAFPLQDPSMPLTELDSLLQRQFDALTNLLKDEAVTVRIVAVQGVCRILALFWDLIPSTTSTPLLHLLTRELAHDTASNAVRAAVPTGLKYLLHHASSPSCISTLRGSSAVKSPITHLAPLVNDTSQRVRSATIELAVEIAKVRGLNWQSIFRPATLLCRLPVEPPSLQLRIARLLLPLHLPAGSSSPSQLEKLVELCVGKRAAAAALLKHLPKLATPAAVVKVLKLLLCAMLADAPPAALLQMANDDEVPEGTPTPSSSSMIAFAAAAASLFDAAAPGILRSSNYPVERDTLLAAYSPEAVAALHERAAGEAAAIRQLGRICAWLPSAHVPHAEATIRKIAAMPADVRPARLAPLIQCACAWDLAPQLVASITNALEPPTDSHIQQLEGIQAGIKRGRPKHARNSRSATSITSEPPTKLSRSLALRLIWAWLDHPTARNSLIETTADKEMEHLRGLLTSAATPCSGQVHSPSGNDVPDALLALACLLQLSWHLAATSAANASDAPIATTAATIAHTDIERCIDMVRDGYGDKDTRDVAPCSPASLISPGEAHGRARARTAAALTSPSKNPCLTETTNTTGGSSSEVSANKSIASTLPSITDASPVIQARLLLSVFLGEAALLGLLESPGLAKRAAEFVSESLRFTAAASVPTSGNCLQDDVLNYTTALGQLLPHAAKLSYQLIDGGGQGVAAGEELLASIISVCVGRDDATMRGTIRTILVEVLAIYSHASANSAHLIGKLLNLILPHVRPEPSGAMEADTINVGSLGLPPLLSQTLDLLIRSQACEPYLRQCARAVADEAVEIPSMTSSPSAKALMQEETVNVGSPVRRSVPSNFARAADLLVQVIG